jgi:hypothetical protein
MVVLHMCETPYFCDPLAWSIVSFQHNVILKWYIIDSLR